MPRRKELADRERRIEAPAVAVLTALGERDALVRDAERRAGQLRTMTEHQGLLERTGRFISISRRRGVSGVIAPNPFWRARKV
jgi:hypothetical protein